MSEKNPRILMMEKGDITKTLFKLGIPMVVSMLVTALYNVVDTYFVANLGTQQSGAVSVSFPLSFYFSGVGLTFGVGAASYVSRLLGAKKSKEANRVASIAFYTAGIIGFVLMIIFLVFVEKILIFMGATETILPYALQYGYIFIVSMFFSTINVCSGNLAIAQGEAKVTLKAMITGAILNMILDPIMIGSMSMGVKGAALATLVSQIITTIIYFQFFFGKKSYVKMKWKEFKPSSEIYREIIKVGVSMLLLQALTGFSMSLISRNASLYGDAAVSAMGIVLRIVTLGTNVVFGFMKGYQPFVGYNYGARNYDRVKKITNSAIKWSTIYCIIWMIIVILFSNSIMSIMINDPEVIRIGTKALKINTAMFFTFGFQFTYATLYLSMGKALAGGILNIGRQGLFLIPVVIILTRLLALNGVIYAQPVADIVSTLITIPLAIKVKNDLKSA
ncbi:MATE family efflux transporter [Clostridium sporogenes]|uniref:MATE family efflux transporter n=1 Tax=Clostridium sporogenes TaxID=1509 RepID=UPI002237E0AB|nr:MATE family efflux transporter [Clostridium sporogenes]EKS4343906.1 MATE family efflux transporter [Clostridium botulinum]EKS4396206.1 MATE family efflux transporter [Clostridium botulinum]MCW6078117.1 MATE family efflux transporter [Clostridium sporogenes]